MGIDEVGYNRKDIETNLGYIFNVPDDYELNESSDNHLFGIIEIPFDAFSKKESIGGSGRGRSRGRRRGNSSQGQVHQNQNPCQKALHSLITELLGRGRGRLTRDQQSLRDLLKNRIETAIPDITIDLVVTSTEHGGLYINFLSPTIPPHGTFI